MTPEGGAFIIRCELNGQVLCIMVCEQIKGALSFLFLAWRRILVLALWMMWLVERKPWSGLCHCYASVCNMHNLTAFRLFINVPLMLRTKHWLHVHGTISTECYAWQIVREWFAHSSALLVPTTFECNLTLKTWIM